MANNLPSYISNLPHNGKKLLVKAYQNSKDSGLSESDSIDNAMFVIGKTYPDKISLNQSFDMKTVLTKEGGIFNKGFYFDAVLSNVYKDNDGQNATKTLLKYLSDNDAIENEGDVFHKAFNGETGIWKGLFKKIKQNFDGTKLNLKFAINKNHDKYKDFLKLHKKEPFTHLSAEFYSPQLVDNKIVFANKLGWTLTNGKRASNDMAKISW